MAIIFELNPSYVPVINPAIVNSQLKILHKLWSAKDIPISDTVQKRHITTRRKNGINNVSYSPLPHEWEDVLAAIVVGKHVTGKLAGDLLTDPGIKVIRKRIDSVRLSFIIKALKLTSRLLMLTVGVDKFKELLRNYWKENTPKLFVVHEAKGFAKYLARYPLKVPCLDELLEFEIALLNTNFNNLNYTIHFKYDPQPILSSLMDRKKPDFIEGDFVVEVSRDKINILKAHT